MKSRKRLWERSVLVVFVLLAFICTHRDSFGQGSSPATQRLVQQSDLVYQGSFRLPQSSGSATDFQYGGASMAFNQANDSLFVQARDGYAAEVRIPALTSSSNYGDLATATTLQSYALVDDQQLRLRSNPADTFVRGFLVYQNQLLVSFASYYDANYAQTTSHLTRPLTLSTVGQGRGPFAVGYVMPGHVAGHMAVVPGEWQAIFGGSVFTGNFGLPIVTRESFGPAAFVFDPAKLGTANPTPASAVLDYPDASHSLGPWDGQSNLWNTTSTLAGMIFVPGSRSVIFFGVHGIGAYCYGDGGAVNPNNGEPWCYDPENGGKGQHAYPYVFRAWAYDANNLAAVKNGQQQSWDPRPYGVWDLPMPMSAAGHVMPSTAFDPTNQRLFVMQGFGPSDPANGFPVIHVYKTGPRGPQAPTSVHVISIG